MAAFVKLGGVTSAKAVSVTTWTVTVPAGGHAAGNLLLITNGWTVPGTPKHQLSATDSRGNTYVLVYAGGGAGSGIETSLLAGVLTTALLSGDTITILASGGFGSVADYAVVTAEYSGMTTTSDVASATNGVIGTAVSIGPITPPSAATLVIGAFYWNGVTTDFTTEATDTAGGASWVNTATTGTTGGSAASNRSTHLAHKLTASSAAQTYAITLGASRSWDGSIAALQVTTPTVLTPQPIVVGNVSMIRAASR